MTAGSHAQAEKERARNALLPVVEIFGPTIQGEGPQAGRPALFVRFGGCDFRCSWCDSLYAVEPVFVREAERLPTNAVIQRLRSLARAPMLVVLTGGNPALLELGLLVRALRSAGYETAVETQGSFWRDWLTRVDQLVISPKPPSSGMAGVKQSQMLRKFVSRLRKVSGADVVFKVVIFDEEDLAWAAQLRAEIAGFPMILSAGTTVGLGEIATFRLLRERYAWLCETAAADPAFADTRILPQLHVLAWGTRRGV